MVDSLRGWASRNLDLVRKWIKRGWYNEIANTHPDTDTPFEEHVITVREELASSVHQPEVPVECGHPGNVL